MGLFDFFKKSKVENKSDLSNETSGKTNVKLERGLNLLTHQQTIHNPTTEQVREAIDFTINAYDEYVLLKWVDEHSSSSIYGIGFGTSYYLEYLPDNAQKGFGYVKEGVSLETTQQQYLAFMHTHRIVLDSQWHWQEVE